MAARAYAPGDHGSARADHLILPSHSKRLERAIACLAVLGFRCALPTANAEPAIGQFELKTLDSEPGAFEFQSQNAWSWGHPDRKVASDDANSLVFDDNAVIRQRHALELEAGFTSSLKMRAGVEFEKERLDDPDTLEQANAFDQLRLTEIGIELIAILVPRRGQGTGVGVVMEFERPLDDEEPDTLIVGPIIEFGSGRWLAAAVPMAVRTFGGRTDDGHEVDNKWDFAYAAQLAYSFSERWLLALEGYGTVERMTDSGHPAVSAQLFGDFDQHRAGAVLYHTYDLGSSRHKESTPSSSSPSGLGDNDDDMRLTIGFGLLGGLNEKTPDHTLKLSIEVDF